jgi:hypothetical protein
LNDSIIFEYSLHTPSPAFWKGSILPVFPGVKTTYDQVIAIATTQHSASIDLSDYSEEAAFQKDLLLVRVRCWADVLISTLVDEGKGVWCDLIDPCSGFPSRMSSSPSVYNEVEGMAHMLGYSTEQAQFCSVLHHPTWGAAVYPATVFTNASMSELQTALQLANDHLKQVLPSLTIEDLVK